MEPGHETVHAGRHMVADQAVHGREQPCGPEELVSLGPVELEGTRKRPDDRGRRMLGAALFEPDEVVHGNARKLRQLFPPQTGGSTASTHSEADVARAQTLTQPANRSRQHGPHIGKAAIGAHD